MNFNDAGIVFLVYEQEWCNKYNKNSNLNEKVDYYKFFYYIYIYI